MFAALLYDTENFANSRRVWKSLSSQFKSNLKFFLEYGRAALASRKYDEAIKALEWAEFLSSSKEKTSYLLAAAYMEMGNHGKAIAKFEKMGDMPEAWYSIALCYRKMNKNLNAAEALDKAEKIAIEKKREDFLTKDFYTFQAYINDKAKRTDKTLEILRKLYEQYPEDHEICNFLGYTLADHDMELDFAQKLLEKALAMEPENGAYLDSMAWTLYKKKDFEGARKFIVLSIKYFDNDPDPVVYGHAGDIFSSLGMKKEALEYWNIASEIFSDDSDMSKIKEKIRKNEEEFKK
jgi:tetratricopeptide (TPR) repeat protein